MREARPLNVVYYQSDNGAFPFEDWLNGLGDPKTRARIDARITRVSTGNLGDCCSVGDGVVELRMQFGAGYRLYCGIDGDDLVLLAGGDKSTQQKDIEVAKDHWRDYSESGA